MSNIKEKNTEKGKSKSKQKTKEKSKGKLKEKNYSINISDEIKQKVLNSKLKLETIFCSNSKIKFDDNELIGFIIIHKILEYKCYGKKCCITNEWNGEPLNLLLVRKNNKQNDIRIHNLEFKCYNCYFQENNNNKDLFIKIKKEIIPECKICKFKLINISKTYKNLGICKICVEKNKITNSSTYINDSNLFLNTFDNNLTKSDFETQLKTTTSIDELFLVAENINKKDNNITLLKNNSKSNKLINNNKPNKTKQKQNETKQTNINININDIDISDLNRLKNLVN